MRLLAGLNHAPLAPLGFAALVVLSPLAMMSYSIDTQRELAAKQTAAAKPLTLVASANDPTMIEAIRYARGVTNHATGGNAWSLPKSNGLTATFATPGGSITLSQKEIAEANFIYPQLRERATDSAHKSASRADDAGDTYSEDGE